MKQTIIAAAIFALGAVAPASAQPVAPANPIGSFFGAIAFGTATMVQGAVGVATSPFELVRPAFAAEPPPLPRARHRAR